MRPKPTFEDRDLRGRWLWKSLPWALYTTCAACGDVRHCRGRARERMLRLECFDDEKAKLRRGGKRGKRAGYAYRVRRSREQSLELVRQLRDQGLVVGAIAERLDLSEKSVRNYLSEAKKRPAIPLAMRPVFLRKEPGG